MWNESDFCPRSVLFSSIIVCDRLVGHGVCEWRLTTFSLCTIQTLLYELFVHHQSPFLTHTYAFVTHNSIWFCHNFFVPLLRLRTFLLQSKFGFVKVVSYLSTKTFLFFFCLHPMIFCCRVLLWQGFCRTFTL